MYWQNRKQVSRNHDAASHYITAAQFKFPAGYHFVTIPDPISKLL